MNQSQMKRVKAKLVGTVMHAATREFVLEYPPDVDPQQMSTDMLEELADQARIPWVHTVSDGVILTDHWLIDGEDRDLPTITLLDTNEDSIPENPEQENS